MHPSLKNLHVFCPVIASLSSLGLSPQGVSFAPLVLHRNTACRTLTNQISEPREGTDLREHPPLLLQVKKLRPNEVTGVSQDCARLASPVPLALHPSFLPEVFHTAHLSPHSRGPQARLNLSRLDFLSTCQR